MGPNGSGKSTLAQVLAGNPAYEVTGGSVTYDGKDLLEMEPEVRAQSGIFLAFQYPVEIPGVSNAYFLRAAYNEKLKAQGQEEVDPLEFADLMDQKLAMVEMDSAMLTRSVNTGFSGGEKKRNEILQMAVLEPRLAILDETDSGLDIDALRIVADGVNKLKRPDNATIVVTHYQRLLNYIVPDFVHVLANGRILKSGGKELALELEEKGYDWVTDRRRAAQAAGARDSSRGGDDVDSGRREQRGRSRTSRRSISWRPRRRRPSRHPVAAPRGVRPVRRARVSDDEERGLALHERRADRRPGVRAARVEERRRAARPSSRRSGSAPPAGTRWCSSTAASRPSCRDWRSCRPASTLRRPGVGMDERRPVSSIASARSRATTTHSFTALNTAFMHDGAVRARSRRTPTSTGRSICSSSPTPPRRRG